MRNDEKAKQSIAEIKILELTVFAVNFKLDFWPKENDFFLKWRRLLSSTTSFKKASLSFFTGIMVWKIRSHLCNSFFQILQLCSFCFLLVTSGTLSEQLKRNFEKMKEVFLKHGFIYKNLSRFLHSYQGLEDMQWSLGPIFQNFAKTEFQIFFKFDLVEIQLSKVDPKLIWIMKFEYYSPKSHDLLFSYLIFGGSKTKSYKTGYEQIFQIFYLKQL